MPYNTEPTTRKRVAHRGRRAAGYLRLVPVLAVVLITGCALAYWPVDGPVTSPYGIRFRGLRPAIHEGVDIAVPVGTPVVAMRGGVVEHAGPLDDYGLAVIVDHGGLTRSLYGHLSSVDVDTGERVESRQQIGLSGRSGNATGAHLHFEIRRRGRSEDPVPLLGGRPRETRVRRVP